METVWAPTSASPASQAAGWLGDDVAAYCVRAYRSISFGPFGHTRRIITGIAVIREYPPQHELLAFFETEPRGLDADARWLYSTLEFSE